jgi:hypothetical protein
MGKQQVCRLVARVAVCRFRIHQSICRYSRDVDDFRDQVLISLLIVAPISMVLVSSGYSVDPVDLLEHRRIHTSSLTR